MPSSYYGFIPDVLLKVMTVNPKSVLDVGVGFGKWGMLFREYLDVFCNTGYGKEFWKVKIDGIEVFAPYIMDHHRCVYSRIFVGDAKDVLPTLDNYDLIFAGDVLEHLSREDGEELLRTVREKARVAILCVPLGDEWRQGVTFGNEYETHRAVWNTDDFQDAQFVKPYMFNDKPLALVIYEV